MPREPEWVKSKPYRRFEVPDEVKLGLKKRTKATKEETTPPQEQPPKPTKPPKPPKPPKPTKAGGTTTPPQQQPTKTPDGLVPVNPDPNWRRGGRPHPGPKPPGQDVVPGSGQDVVPGQRSPGRIWGFAERVFGPAIDRKPDARPHSGPDRRSVDGRQGRALGQGPDLYRTEEDRRRADIANLVSEVMDRRSVEGVPEGEVVSEGKPMTPPEDDRSIWTGEVVGHNEGRDTGKFRAIEPGSWDARTASLPKIRTDTTVRLPVVSRAGDTRVDLPAVGHPRTALTQHAEPFGQMSLFHPKESPLATAQAARTEVQTPPPTVRPVSRQMSLFQPGKFKIT
jgi:hypothetical protein